jgi:tRNA threonylcarbamoyladenosine biosynthesis protein TsaE
MTFESNSVEETIAHGKEFAKSLKPGDIVCLEGDLGAGKTHFVKGMASQFGIEKDKVSSPTFTLINEYEADIPIFHFDCYRLKNEDEALEIGIEEYLFGDGVSVIEWSSKIENLIPEDSIRIEIKHNGKTKRSITILDR